MNNTTSLRDSFNDAGKQSRVQRIHWDCAAPAHGYVVGNTQSIQQLHVAGKLICIHSPL